MTLLTLLFLPAPPDTRNIGLCRASSAYEQTVRSARTWDCAARAAYNASMLLNSAVYIDGRRTVTPATLEEDCRICRQPGKFAWIILHEPTEDELASVVCKLGLDELAVEDARMPQQRPKLEQYGDCLFAVLKPVRYGQNTKRIEYGEIHAFVEQDFILTACYGEDLALGSICEGLEGKREQFIEALRRSSTRF